MTTPETTEAPLVIALFGPMQAWVEGRPLPHLRSRKTLWLLALLTLRHGRPVEREWLAGTLWPEADQSQAFANLRPALSELRRALGSQSERLQSPSRHTLLLELTGAQADVVAFDAAIKDAKLPALKQAVTLYRGPLLEGFLEEWVHQERAVREQNCLRALQTLAEAAMNAGDYAAATDGYRQAVSIDPLWEMARRGWMQALAKNGDSNAALQVYREFAERLRKEANAVPDEKTRALYEHLRTRSRQRASAPSESAPETAPRPRVVGYLPHPLTDLVGREDEREEVADRLRRSRLVTLTGLGGIGKTRLAIAIASEVASEYADGVWLAALETLTDARLLPRHIASALSLREEPGQTALESVTDHLRAKRLLLVVDNCEHLLEASAQVVGHLLRECAGIRVLATSREALGITGETAWAVPSLAAPNLAHLPAGRATLLRVLMSYESVQLFVERAQAVQKTFMLNGNNAQAVAQICSQLEGIPLALELAAARVKALSVEQIASRLHDHLGLLTGGSRTAITRQQTLRATLDWSQALLSEPERLLLRRLAAFTGGWSLDAAESVCAGESLDVWQTLDLLTSLVDKSLVVFEEREGTAGRRYRLLEMVRQYAAEMLQASGEGEQVKARHRDWFLALAEETALHLKGSDQGQWLQRLDAEYDNLRAALAWSGTEAQGAETELRLTGALWRFWYVRGDCSEGRQYLGHALAREGAQAQTTARAKALNGAGSLAYDQADYAAAQALFEESLRISRQLADEPGIAGTLGNLGNVALSLGEIVAARALYEESLALKRASGDKHGIALTLGNLGVMARQQGDYAYAKTLFEESLRLAEERGDKLGMGRALLNLGNVARQQGDPVLSRSFFEESLRLARELGDRQGVARSLGSLGAAAYNAGEWETARALHKESLSVFQEIGDRQGVAHTLGNLGDIACEKTDYASARALYKESLSLFRELGDRRGVAESLEQLAAVLLSPGEVRKAACLWGAADALRQTLGTPLTLQEREKYDRQIEKSRATLGQDIFASAWAEGRALIWEQAADFALTE